MLKTTEDWSPFILRVTVGLIMLPHGLQKVFGMFGGFGLRTTMNFFTETMRLPWIIAFLVVALEFIGSIGLILGIASRAWALGLICVMTGAIYTTNAKHGFFMNWFGTQAGEGYEYHLLFIGMCLVILIEGSGKFSVDGWMR